MKNIILILGESLLGVAVVLGIIAAILTSLPFFQMGQITMGIITLISYLMAVVIMSFLVYLLIDIRDKISENNSLLSNKK